MKEEEKKNREGGGEKEKEKKKTIRKSAYQMSAEKMFPCVASVEKSVWLALFRISGLVRERERERKREKE